MNYNIEKLEKQQKKNRNGCSNYYRKEVTLTKQNNLTKLMSKLKELENRLEFCNKYQTNFSNDSDDVIINESLELVNCLIMNFDRNIILKAKFDRNCKDIEFEF